jgi:hypothetical protein
LLVPNATAPARRGKSTSDLRGLRFESVGWDKKSTNWTQVDRDYESVRIDMQTLFDDFGINTAATITWTPSGSIGAS